jgi:taurine dioxygenase
MKNTSIRIDPLTGALGAVVHGVNLAEPMDDATFEQVNQAFLEHCVIFFRQQHLDPDQHKRFAARFGALNIHPYIAGLPDHPEVMEFVKEPAETGYNLGGKWHSDTTFLDTPALGSVLYAHEVPPSGGDTIFANTYRAYESLSPAMQDMLGKLRAVHSSAGSYGKGGNFDRNRAKGQGSMSIDLDEASTREASHPVIRVHPQTGRKLLFVNPNFTQRFEEMTVEESKPLLEFLYAHQHRPEFTCRFRWEQHSVAFWDNRCTQHLAVNDYDGFRRRMHRVTIEGDRPV